jgi:predicted TIM-barrel fold metal-dependent hydrolase
MTMPVGIGIVDTMIGFPTADFVESFHFITRQTKDRESREEFESPVEYLFKESPRQAFVGADDPVAITLAEMDRWGVERGLIGVGGGPIGEVGVRALTEHPDRFVGSVHVDPNRGMKDIRFIQKAYETWGIRAVTLFPAGTSPQIAINGKQMYPIYAKCSELGIAVFCTAGIPGPRLKFEPQHVEHIDEVMFDFPDLVFVTRHGCEPWTELAVKLMVKWPNLYYSTSAFAPRYYPKDIVDYANTRGADKVLYAGYFPMGLSLERIINELPDVPFKDEVWPKFLRENALRVLGI